MLSMRATDIHGERLSENPVQVLWLHVGIGGLELEMDHVILELYYVL